MIDLELFDELKEEEKKKRCLSKSRNLLEFMSNDEFLNPVIATLDKCPGEIFLMILKNCIKFRSSLSQISSMLQLFNNMFDQTILPETRYRLNNILNESDGIEYHGICPNCCQYIGKIENFHSSVICNICEEIVDLTSPSSSNIFILINPSSKIKRLLEDNETYYEYVMKHRKYDGTIRDIFDGKCYRSFVKNLPEQERYSYVTTIFNTDGAPRFESSQFSVWPMYLQINEIPIDVRFKNIIPCGIWFGRNKPEMSTFLHPFTEMMNKVSTDGISCSIKDNQINVKVYCLTCSVDSVARAPIQGVKQFNGTYGCNWCLHTGKYLERSMRYPIVNPIPHLRTKSNMLKHLQLLTSNGKEDSVYGVTRVSPFINLEYFDIVDGFIPDFMHCCLAGVSKHVLKLILSKFPEVQLLLNEMLLRIKVPHQLERLTRSLDDMADWKAKEWLNFTLYYSLPLFHSVNLPKKIVNYWKLYVDSLFTLLQEKIPSQELDEADEKLYKFVFLTQQIFSESAMNYNIHLLLHLGRCVLNWGPLWCHSTFPFETANHHMLTAIHCSKGVNLQIVRYINILQSARYLESKIFPHASQVVIDYCRELSVKRLKKSLKLRSVTYLGCGKLVNDKACQLGLTVEQTFAYDRVIISSILFASSDKVNKRSNNSYAQLIDGTFVKIKTFIVDVQKNEEITLCQIVNTSATICKFGYCIRSIGHEIIQISTNAINKICIFIENDTMSYILTIPNKYHY